MSSAHNCTARIILAALLLSSAAWPAAAPPTGGVNAALLGAEIALGRGDCRTASQSYLDAALQSSDLRVAARAADVTLDCAQFALAEQVVTRWRALAPNDASAMLAAVRVQLGRYRISSARTPLQQWLRKAAGDQVVTEGIDQLAEQSGVDATLALLRDTRDARLATQQVLPRLAELAADGWDFNLALQYSARARRAGAAPETLAALDARAQAGLGQDAAALTSARLAASSGGAPLALPETLLMLGREDEAETELRRLGRQPQLVFAAERRLALLAFARSDYGAANAHFRRLLSDENSAAVAVYYLALMAERSGDDEVALRGYELLLETGFEAAARRRVAAIYYRDGEQRQALRLLSAGEDASVSERVGAELAVADLLASEGSAAEGVLRLDTALQNYPGHPELSYQRAVLLERSDSEAAIAALEVLARERGEDMAIANALGFTLADHKRELPRAERLIRAALQAQPDNPAVLDSMGWVLYQRGQAGESLPYLQRAFRLFRDGEIGSHLGEALWSVGRHDEARAVWKQALAADPDNKHLLEVARRYAPELSPPRPPQIGSGNDTAV